MFGRRPPSGSFIRERSFLRLLSLLGFARAEFVKIVYLANFYLFDIVINFIIQR